MTLAPSPPAPIRNAPEAATVISTLMSGRSARTARPAFLRIVAPPITAAARKSTVGVAGVTAPG